MLPPAVHTYVRDFDARRRRLALLGGIGASLSFFGVWLLVCCAIDRVAHFASSVRAGLLAAGLVGFAAILWRPLRASMRRRVDWIHAAGRIEQSDPQFGQRLVTVASRVLGAAEHRGSDDMLRELIRDVDRRAANEDPAKLLPLRRIAAPWVAVAITLLAYMALGRIGNLQMHTLTARFLSPWADILPATTTRLGVPTGNRDVVQSESLRIEADVTRLGSDSVVSLYISEDDSGRWSRSTMDPLTPGGTRFAFTVAAIDRDFRYRITAGDATSRTYAVRVRRAPAVERFAIRHEYPSYTNRSPVNVTNSDGQIEAPIGTRILLTVTATEPLDYALLKLGTEKILMERDGGKESGTRSSRIRVAAFTIKRDGAYSLDLISDRQVPGEGPAGTMRIRALPDGKPLVSLRQAGESLRLHPREIISLGYQSLDDYGIARLSLSVQVNSSPPVERAIAIQGDPRRQERQCELDLATMPLAVGDVVTVTLNATDRAEHQATSEPVHVLISPRSVDVATYQRIAELNTAATQAATLYEQLTQASAALEETDREAAKQSLAYQAARFRVNRQLTGAAEAALLMRQALFRVLVSAPSSELANALSVCIDQAQTQSWLAEDLFRRGDAPAGMGTESRGLLARSLETTRVLRDEMKVIAGGERAVALIADRENLLASEQKAAATTQPADVKQRLEQTLQRAREEIAAGAKEIGLDIAAGDFDAQLKGRVEAAAAVLRTRQRIDFAAAGKEWVLSLKRDRTQPVVLNERLAVAAQAEAVRQDADLTRAHDVHLASQAAANIESAAQADPAARVMPPTVFDEYSAALSAVLRQHDLRRQAGPATPEEQKAAGDAALQARGVLQRFVTSPEFAKSSDISSVARNNEVEELALRASAETAARNYAKAAELDAVLAAKLTGSGGTTPQATQPSTTSTTVPATNEHREIAQTVVRAATIDQLGGQQQRLASETTGLPESQAVGLADRQRDMAAAIGRVNQSTDEVPEKIWADDTLADDPNWRGRATAAVLAAQESLAAMPQQLAAVQESLPAWREAIARAEQAKRDAAAMPDQQRQPAAQRTAIQADRDAADAAKRFQARQKPVSPAVVGNILTSLTSFAPETTGACNAIDSALLPSLKRLESAANAGDVAEVTRAADEARQSIDAVQKELTLAQDAMTARDPLIAAKWFARDAAESLERTPPDLRWAQMRQRDTTAALSRALDREIHDAAALRMALVPAMQSVYAVAPSPGMAGPTTATTTTVATTNPALAAKAATEALLRPGLAAVREWARVRPRVSRTFGGAMRESDPAGYEEPLRLYFEALGKGSIEPPK
jgi:hypothetical protein